MAGGREKDSRKDYDPPFPMESTIPNVFVMGGPNGAGKSTAAPRILRDILSTREFVNADVIARGLSGFDPDRAAMQAGRTMLSRLRELARERRDFAFETTLASRSFAPWLSRLREDGYRVHLVYVWVPDPETSVRRVQLRVLKGGHNVPPDVVRRRYKRGLGNLRSLYMPIADHWRIYDNTSRSGARLVAYGGPAGDQGVLDEQLWKRIDAETRA
jgi:predicted ABC-type ATPase